MACFNEISTFPSEIERWIHHQNFPLRRRNPNRILPHPIDRRHQGSPRSGVKQPDKADRLVKRRLRQLRDIFHIPIQLNVFDNSLYKRDLPLVQRLVVDENRKRLHRRIKLNALFSLKIILPFLVSVSPWEYLHCFLPVYGNISTYHSVSSALLLLSKALYS